MRTCDSCGAEILDISRFCHICGHPTPLSTGPEVLSVRPEWFFAKEDLLVQKFLTSPGLPKLKKLLPSYWEGVANGDKGAIGSFRKLAVRVTGSSMFPSLLESFHEAFTLFGQPGQCFEVFVGLDPEFGQENAVCTFDGETPVFYFVNKILPLMSEQELKCIVGHEVGHCILRHPLHIDHRVTQGLAERPLEEDIVEAISRDADIYASFALSSALSWCQELNADRFALLLTRDLSVAMGAFVKLVLGFSPPTPLDAEAFLRQFTPSTPDDLIESPSHPDFPKCCHALKLFSDSNVYQSLVGGSGGRPINEIDSLVSEIVPEAKSPTNQMIEVWLMEFVLMATVAAIDGKVTPKEDEVLRKSIPPPMRKQYEELWTFCEESYNRHENYQELMERASLLPDKWKTRILKRMVTIARSDRKLDHKELSEICHLAVDIKAQRQCDKVFLNELGLEIQW